MIGDPPIVVGCNHVTCVINSTKSIIFFNIQIYSYLCLKLKIDLDIHLFILSRYIATYCDDRKMSVKHWMM